MANVQKQFEEFHSKIKLERFDENETLRAERDAVLKALRAGLKKVLEKKKVPVPAFTPFNQGSYAMNTGVKSLTGRDYDIDVGIEMDFAKGDHDPVEVKKWVRDALADYGKGATIRRSCVTVFKDGYHVDLAIYAYPAHGRSKHHLAKGKENSGDDHRVWQVSDPKGLQEKIADRFSGDDAKQFRHSIRYLKRWRDQNFNADGNAAPIGIGLTVAAYHWFVVSKTTDRVTTKTTYDDRDALERFVRQLISQFSSVWHAEDNCSYSRLKVDLPVEPWSDLFEKMTGKQMESFKAKLEALLTALETARSKLDIHDACKVLEQQFGSDFPVPPKQDTSKATRGGISGSGSSGC